MKTAGIDVERFYRQYGPMVLRRCRQLLVAEEEAFDAMQETLVEALRHPERLKQGVASSVMLRIATEICLARLRGKPLPPEGPHGELLLRIANAVEPSLDTVRRSFWDRLFNRETESTQALAVMLLVDGMSVTQAAHEVRIAPALARRRLRQLVPALEELSGVLP